MSVDRAIELFKDWMRAKRPIHKTGINGNANCMAKTLPLFQKFVQAYPDFWVKEFGYTPKGKPGQKSEHYITFTSKILGPALEQLTGERPLSLTLNTQLPAATCQCLFVRFSVGKILPKSRFRIQIASVNASRSMMNCVNAET